MRLYQDFKSVVRFLNQRFPLSIPVRVIRIKMSDGGYTTKTKKGFLIAINKHISKDAQILILLHEFSHCIVFDVPLLGDHDAQWGVAYSHVYKAFIGTD